MTFTLFFSLSDSEMHGVYLKSVRSPAVQGKFKMSYRNQHNMDIFSQVHTERQSRVIMSLSMCVFVCTVSKMSSSTGLISLKYLRK